MTETRSITLTGVQQYFGDPKRNIRVLLTVDWEKLSKELGVKAAYSKGKKSRAMRGAVVAKFVEELPA